MRGFTRGKGEKRCNHNFKNKRKNKENYFPLPLPFWVDYCGIDTPRAMIFHFQTSVLISGQSPSTRLGWWALETRCLLFTARSLKTHIRIRALPSPPYSLPRCFLPALPSLPSPPLSSPVLASLFSPLPHFHLSPLSTAVRLCSILRWPSIPIPLKFPAHFVCFYHSSYKGDTDFW